MTRLDFKSAMEEILGLRHGALKDSDTRDTVESWTSVADVQILTFISTELGLEPEAELVQAETYGDLVNTLVERGALT